MPGKLGEIADHARALRELFRGLVRKHMDPPLTPTKALDEVVPLNTRLECDEASSQILRQNDDDRDRLELRLTRRWRSPEPFLPIDEALAKFVCEENFADVKTCERHNSKAGAMILQDGDLQRSRQTSCAPITGLKTSTDKPTNASSIK
jgi:hypothetical protein